MSERALPQRTEDNARFWDSCLAHAMELQRCDECERFWYYPSAICPHCGSLSFTWTPVSGTGVVHSFTWVHRPAPGFEDLVPYVYALVEIDEGPMLATNVVNVDEQSLTVGLPVQINYLDVNDEFSLPLYEPRAS